MHINPSRKRTNNIMAHQGFGELVIIKDEAIITVPESCIFKSSGLVKKNVLSKIECLNTKNVQTLESVGVKCELRITK